MLLVAVIPFKVALSLERQRQENDDKVKLLYVEMVEMMDTICL
jgi:hypothetical protein